jgi:hypothetical protein
MISTYELRLGNFILVNHHLKQVSGIASKTVFAVDAEEANQEAASEVSQENINPIALSDDVLKECGFVFHDYFKFWQLITTGIRSEMNISPDYEVIDFMRKPILKKLTSLHQLQNIYFMLKERELKLDTKALSRDSKKLAAASVN